MGDVISNNKLNINMNPLDQFKNINASQKAIEAAMGSIAKLDWVNEMTKRIQYPCNGQYLI